MSVYSVSGKGFLFYNRNQKEKGEDAMSVVDNIRFTFLYIEFYSMGKTWVYPETYIPYNIFRYVSKGKAVFCIDDEVVTVEENQIVYIPSGCRMSCHVLSESFEFYSIRFTTSVFYEGEDVLKEYYGIPRVQENQGEDMYFKEIYQWVKKESAVKKCFVRGYLDLLIGSLAMRGSMERAGRENFLEQKETKELQHKEIKKKEQIDPRIQMVADYIVLHPEEKYTPQKMAEMAELSKQRFSSLFKINIGKTPMEYVREIRLTAAARALLVSNDNINDIAYQSGYEDANYFIREFKSAFGFTPNQYRKEARE
jgi:AraC-like DNA-binding protein